MKVIVIILAAGSGSRFTGSVPKQYIKIDQLNSLEHSIKKFQENNKIDNILVVINQNDKKYFDQIFLPSKVLRPISGGSTRQESVKLALLHLIDFQPTKVIIHDAVRPFVDQQTITKLVESLNTNQAAIAVSKVVNTIKKAKDNSNLETLNRCELYNAETPQAFNYSLILKLHQENNDNNITDDAVLCERARIPIALVETTNNNFKITYQHDLNMAKLLSNQHYETRIGFGFDVHAFKESKESTIIKLGGIAIKHNKMLKAHSDGDVVLHALVDAILGSIAAGDIGIHFPASDPKLKDIDSVYFVNHAVKLLKQQDAQIINIDITIIAESPKIAPYSEQIIENLSSILAINSKRVSLKATTTERLGFTGRGEGIAAQVIVNVKLPIIP